MADDTGELTMQISGICRKDGKKVAYVYFKGGGRLAECVIPDCRVIRSSGFSDEEKGQLELYMKMNLAELKKKAACVDPIRAMMHDEKS